MVDPKAGCLGKIFAKRAAAANEKRRVALEKKYLKTEAKLEKLKKNLTHGLTPKIMSVVDTAFVTFEYEESRKRCLDDYRSSAGGFGRFFAPKSLQFPHPRLKDKKGQPLMFKLRIDQAPEPGNIFWENLSLSDSERSRRSAITGFLTFVLLLVSFTIIYLAESQQRLAAKSIPDVAMCSTGLPAVFGGEYNTSASATWDLERGVNGTQANGTCPTGEYEIAYDWYRAGADLPPVLDIYGNAVNRTASSGAGSGNPLVACDPNGPYAKAVLRTSVPDRLYGYWNLSAVGDGWELGAQSGCNELCDGRCWDPLSTAPCYQLACYESTWQDAGETCAAYTQNTPVGCYCISEFEKKTAELGFRGALDELGADPLCSGFMGSLASAYGLKLLSIGSVIVINSGLETVIKSMAGFERHLSVSGRASSVVIKQTLAKFLNTAMIALIVNAGYAGTLPSAIQATGVLQGAYNDFDKGWYVKEGRCWGCRGGYCCYYARWP